MAAHATVSNAMTQSANDTLKFLRSLRAVREYTPEPVSDADINAILEVARWSATAANRQPHEVVVVRDADVKQKFGEWGARPAANASVVFLIVTVATIYYVQPARLPAWARDILDLLLAD